MNNTITSTSIERPVEHPAIEALRSMGSEIEMGVLTSYTLADAIREGAGVTKQAHGSYVNEETSCSLGAAYLAARARGYIA